MGGFGSGRKPSYLARKDTVESCPRVQVASLKNKIHEGLEHVTLNLCRREFVVKLTWYQCNYGGLRPWILCPKCGKKVGVLYLKLSKLACRGCQRLTYAMSQTSKIDRPLLQNRRRCKKKLGRTQKPWKMPKLSIALQKLLSFLVSSLQLKLLASCQVDIVKEKFP
ncbi:hypothetical protein WA1_29050 [Scytonema hofmannii PCC 7110]|uniref:Uncharacterized protein n=1 Tax=Scytonema hofmannii PCC 7110 TaxID=128403 RepID=A0A139X5N3_9CYAN|nr:hypothetical protein WA1_29050 [Scytonema hofmannii PCC 7110]